MKSVIIYSGGLDSTVLLYKLASEGSAAGAVSVNYGQRHSVELEMAAANCAALGVPHFTADLSGLAPVFGASALTDTSVAVPEADYARDNIAVTVVPNRNMILLAIAAARAMAAGCDSVAYAAHGGDHALYSDCTVEFADALEKAIRISSDGRVGLLRPFIGMTKADIVRLGADLGVDFAKTWSCYNGGSAHCGRCSTCRERREAFRIAGVSDPTVYLA